MKKLLLLLVCFFTLQLVVNAQQQTPATTQQKTTYACPMCYATSGKAGQCAHCKVDMVKMGDYYCPHCMKDGGTAAGKCKMCGASLVKMTPEEVKKHKSMTM
jgi:hypothetical protein